MNIRVVFFLLVSNFLGQLNGQQIIEHLTKKDGLPSNQINGIAQDKEGYIWFSTPNGAVRYDGKSMKTYTVEDGLTTNEVIGFFVDPTGKVWIICFGGHLCYYENGRIYNHKSDHRLEKLPKNFFSNSAKILNDSVIYSAEEVINNGIVSGYVRYLNIKTMRLVKELLQVRKTSDITYTLRWYISEYKWQGSLPIDMFAKNDLGIKIIEFETGNHRIFQLEDYRVFVLDKKGNILLRMSPGFRINGVLEEADKRLYLFSEANLFLYEKSNLYSTVLPFKMTSICENKDGNLWLSSSQGAYCIKGKSLKIPKKSRHITDPIYCFFKKNGTIYAGADSNRVFDIKRNRVYSNTLSNAGASRVLDLFEWKHQIYTLGDLPSYNLHTQKIQTSISSGANKNIVRISENRYLYATWRSLEDLTINQGKTEIATIYNKRVFNAFYSAKDKTIWASTETGLIYRTLDSVNFNRISPPFKDVDIVKHINQDIHGNMLFSTNNGIVVKSGKNYFNLNQNNGLISNSINKTILSNKGDKLFVCTNKGFNVVNYSIKKNKLVYSIKTYTTSDGLPSEEVYTAIEDSSFIYLGTEGGLTTLPLNDTIKPIRIPIRLESIWLNESKWDSLLPDLKHYENTLEFRFSAFYYLRNKEMLFSYILTPLNQVPIISNKPEIIYRGLEPNDYKLEVFAYDKHYPRLIRSKAWTYEFTIHPPFYKTWWFYVLVTGVVLTSIFIIYIMYTRRKQSSLLEKQQLLKQMAVHKLDALKGQMNPHFVFNSLNTVQHFVSNHNIKEAMHFIAKFSSLIRKMLEHARQELIQLDKELVFLREYADIEQIRYSQNFDIVFNLDVNGEEGDIEIPPMLIQPLIENAIKHGVSNLRERRGLIEVNFKILDDNQLFVLVTDNGIGDKGSIKKESSKSMAVNIIRDRLSIYEVNGRFGHFSIDMSDAGTKACLKIPIKS